MTPNIADIIRHHVSLEVRCIDRLYLHAYMPKLQTSGGLCYFLRDYLGNPIPSPALFKPMHDRFVTAVEEFVTRHAIPVVHFETGQDKDAIATAHRLDFVELPSPASSVICTHFRNDGTARLLPSPLAGEGGLAKRGRMRGVPRNANASLRHAPLIRLGATRRSTFSHKGRREGSAPPQSRATP